MQYSIPDYYKEFHCIADQCEETCCAGWQIMIDKKSLKKYIHTKVHTDGHCFVELIFSTVHSVKKRKNAVSF